MNKKNKYQVCLATPFEDFEADVSRYPLYESIGKLMEQKGKKTFIPHRDIMDDWPDRKVYTEVNEVIIPSTELVIGDIGMRDDGIGSTAVGMMITTALQHRIPLIFFYKQGRKIKDKELNLFYETPEIEYQTDKELLKRLETKVKEFF
jgi:hypothetical protein